MEKAYFRLYLTGSNPNYSEMAANLEIILGNKLGNNYTMDVIYAVENPDFLEEDGIIATPTLKKKFPLPEEMMIGEVDNEEKILEWLGL